MTGTRGESGPSFHALPPGPAALFVGHPGHELCVHGWLEQARPFVFILTDGSGRNGRSRLASTNRLLRASGARACQPSGRFSDAAVYDALLHGRHEPLLAVAVDLADALLRLDVRYLVSDPLDGYNPSHDVCRMLAGLAAQRVRCAGRPLAFYEALLTTQPDARPDDSWLRLDLDEPAFARKLEAARRYAELAGEIESAFARSGSDLFRREWLRPVADPLALTHPGTQPPYYETYGQRQVAAGLYPEAVRYRRHVLPFLESVLRESEGPQRCAA